MVAFLILLRRVLAKCAKFLANVFAISILRVFEKKKIFLVFVSIRIRNEDEVEVEIGF